MCERTLGVAELTEIAIFTADVERAVEFYERLLGRAPAERYDGMATFELGGLVLRIHVASPPQEGMPPSEDHVAFRVSELDAAATELGADGPRDYYWGRSAYLRDPDGRLLELQ